jgi:iron only hydrogenase large subunit-like protein
MEESACSSGGWRQLPEKRQRRQRKQRWRRRRKRNWRKRFSVSEESVIHDLVSAVWVKRKMRMKRSVIAKNVVESVDRWK